MIFVLQTTKSRIAAALFLFQGSRNQSFWIYSMRNHSTSGSRRPKNLMR